MKKTVRILSTLGMCLFICSCTTTISSGNKDTSSENSAIFESAEKNLRVPTPSVRTEKDPQVLVHYMPWFQAPPVSDGYGFHWHQGGAKFDPYQVLANGQLNIASHYYPLTGPYDTRDKNVLEYQAALMKVSGIDGVIFDWYGIENALDYKEIQESTLEVINVLKKAGLKYAICYEDQSIGKMIEAGNFEKEQALDYGKKVFAFMEKNWFHDDAYLKYEGRPVVYTFGPQYFFYKEQWDELFAQCSARPYFITLEGHSEGFADGSYNWFNMNGKKTIPQVVSQLNNFYQRQNEKPFLTATVYSGFHDIYAEAGGKSYGYLNDYEGRTFNLTLDAALKAYPDVIQVATWNDYGEGTIIEPTVQNGYRELEALQKMQKKFDSDFPYSELDLRAPLALYKLIVAGENEVSGAKRAAARNAMDAILGGDVETYRAVLSKERIAVDYAVRAVLHEATSETSAAAALYDAAGRKNLALGAPIVANSKIYDFVGSKSADGDVNTYWEGAANKYPNTLQVDLINSIQLDIAVLKLNPQKIWGKRTQLITVEISDNGSDFTTLIPEANYEFNPLENSNTVVINLNAKARYLRFTFTKNTGANAGQLAELEVYAAQ